MPDPQPQPVHVIGLLDVYAEQVKMGAQLDVIKEQLKAIPDHEARMRALERFRFTLLGAAIAGEALAGVIGWFLAQR